MTPNTDYAINPWTIVYGQPLPMTQVFVNLTLPCYDGHFIVTSNQGHLSIRAASARHIFQCAIKRFLGSELHYSVGGIGHCPAFRWFHTLYQSQGCQMCGQHVTPINFKLLFQSKKDSSLLRDLTSGEIKMTWNWRQSNVKARGEQVVIFVCTKNPNLK